MSVPSPGYAWFSGAWWYWQAYRTWIPYSRLHAAALEQRWLELASGESAAVDVGGTRQVIMVKGRPFHWQERTGDRSRCRNVARLPLDSRAAQEVRESAHCTLRHMAYSTLEALDGPGQNPHGTSRLTEVERELGVLSGMHSIASLQRTAAEQLASLHRDDWIIGWEDAGQLPCPRLAGFAQRAISGITEANGQPVLICALGCACTSPDCVKAHPSQDGRPSSQDDGLPRTVLDVPADMLTGLQETEIREIDQTLLERYKRVRNPPLGHVCELFCAVPWSSRFFRSNPNPHPTIKQLSGYSALLAEVARNGFEHVLSLPVNAQTSPGLRSLEDVVVSKSLNECQQRKAFGDRLNYAEILAVLLYTGTDVQGDMHHAHRTERDFGKWKQLRCELMCAISKLHRTMPVLAGRPEYLYHGSRRRIFDLHEAVYKKGAIPYCDFLSTSTSALPAQGFLGSCKGVVLQISRTPDLECADVSWISKHEHEAEVLINPCLLRWRGQPFPSIIPRSAHPGSEIDGGGFMLVRVEADAADPLDGSELGLSEPSLGPHWALTAPPFP